MKTFIGLIRVAVVVFGAGCVSHVLGQPREPLSGPASPTSPIMPPTHSETSASSGQYSALHSKSDAQARFKQATALTQQGQDDEAIAAFNRLIEQYPELPEPYNNLAALYAKQGRLDTARTTLEAALNAHPNYALAYQNLGKLYLQLAERAVQRTLELEPYNTRTQQLQQSIQSILAPTASTRPSR